MARENGQDGRKSPAKKKSGGGNSALRSVVAGAASTEALVDLIEKLGVVDLVMDRVKGKIQDADVDEIFDEVARYLRRNPEVLVVTLGAATLATGLAVWLNSRREWDGSERRRVASQSEPQRTRKAS